MLLLFQCYKQYKEREVWRPGPLIVCCVVCGSIYIYIYIYFFFFKRESFNLWRPLLMIAIFYQTKTLISFWCKRRIKPQISYLQFFLSPYVCCLYSVLLYFFYKLIHSLIYIFLAQLRFITGMDPFTIITVWTMGQNFSLKKKKVRIFSARAT